MGMKPVGVAFVVVLVGTSCAGGQTRGTTAADLRPDATTNRVIAKNIAFKPQKLTVMPGTTVTWRNQDEGVRHTVTAGKPGDKGIPGVRGPKPHKLTGLFEGNLADAGATFSFAFEEPGTYPYFCEVHPSMTAAVVVK